VHPASPDRTRLTFADCPEQRSRGDSGVLDPPGNGPNRAGVLPHPRRQSQGFTCAVLVGLGMPDQHVQPDRARGGWREVRDIERNEIGRPKSQREADRDERPITGSGQAAR